MKAVLTWAAMALLAATPVWPQGPQGVAFAEAPENSGGHCFGGSPESAFACAREACVKGGEGLRPSDCLRVRWCFPAGWSAEVAVRSEAGPHWHEHLCGWDSRAAVEAAATLSCDLSRRTDLAECALVRVWSPEGREMRPE